MHFQPVATHSLNHASADELFMSHHQQASQFKLRPQPTNTHGSCGFLNPVNAGFLNQPAALNPHSSFEGSGSHLMSGDFGSASFSQGGCSPPAHHQQFLPPMNSVMNFLMRGGNNN